MMYIKKLVFVLIGVIVGLTTFTIPADATESNIDPNNVTYSGFMVELSDAAAASADVKLVGSANQVLNVSGKIPKAKIKKCWTVKVGTKIQNEVVKDGKRVAIKWTVPKGDNKFCYVKGKGKQVYKYSCGNRVWGVPGHKSPKRKIPLLKGTYKIVNYLTYEASANADAEIMAATTLHICDNYIPISMRGRATSRVVVTFRSRSITSARATAAEKLKIVSKQSQSIYGNVKAAAYVQLSIKVSEYNCGSTPPPPVVSKPQVKGPTINDVPTNNERNVTFTGKLAKGTSGFASASAGTGQILGSNRMNLVVDNDGYFSVTFRYKAGDEPGRDTVTVVIDQSDGQSVSTTTMGRDSAGNEVPNFEIRKPAVDDPK
jgi:hypothetical protein